MFFIKLLSATLFVLSSTINPASADDPQPSPQIIGGEVAGDNEPVGHLVLSSTVALMNTIDGKFKSFCSGTLISKDLILTAAHCLEPDLVKGMQVYFGAHLPIVPNAIGLVEVEKFQKNSSYDPQTSKYDDLALLKLKVIAPPGFEAVPILDESVRLVAGDLLLLAGFGIIQEIPNTKKSEDLRFTRVALDSAMDKVLVTDQTQGKGACVGDSGGPAYWEQNGQIYLVGSTRGPHDGASDCAHFGEYIYVSKFRAFIIEAAQTLGAETPKSAFF